MNCCEKVELENSIPFEVADSDLEDELYVEGYVNGEDSKLVRFAVDHDATVIESDGTEIRIAPRDVQFQSAKLWQRMLTNFAGPLNNFILTFVLCVILVFMQGGMSDPNTSKLGEIMPDSPASQAGLKQGDEIKTIADKKISNWNDLVDEIQKNPGKPLEVKYTRDGPNQNNNLNT